MLSFPLPPSVPADKVGVGRGEEEAERLGGEAPAGGGKAGEAVPTAEGDGAGSEGILCGKLFLSSFYLVICLPVC